MLLDRQAMMGSKGHVTCRAGAPLLLEAESKQGPCQPVHLPQAMWRIAEVALAALVRRHTRPGMQKESGRPIWRPSSTSARHSRGR